MWIWFFYLTVLTSLVSTTEKNENFRLPRNLVPRHYALRLLPKILDGDNATVHGFVQIDVNCAQTTQKIIMHAVDINVILDSVKIYDRASREQFPVQNITEDPVNQFLIFHLRRKSLTKGANYVMAMNFVSRLNNEVRTRGFYRLNYVEEGQPRVMLLTQFQPIHARQVFPCFDEPNLKADFTITVGRPVNMISVSNMPIYKTTPAQEYPGYEWDFFHRSFPMSTYIVSVAVLDSPSWMYMKNKNANLRIWARPSLLNQTSYPLEVTNQMLDFYQNYLEVDFPLPKQDLVAVPGLDSAMENWGLVIYGEHFLTYKDGVTSASEKELNALVGAHEMAHQWFGNLVTIDWWTDIWLNEGIATYLSYEGVNEVFPEFKMMQQFILNEMQKVMYDDALITTHSVYKSIENVEQILWVFDPISYKKSASLLRMLAGFLGEKAFKQGLKRYLLELQYKNVVQNDLWAAFTRQAIVNKVALPYEIKSVMETWTHNDGYPVVTIARNYSARTATAAQSRFLLHEKNYTSTGNLWFIPLSFVSPSKKTRTVWLSPLARPENIPDFGINPDQWIIVNVNRTGFYRVNYDDRNWNLIWAQLVHDPFQIPIINRAQLLDDAFNLARADFLDYGTPFSVANYLRKETEYLPWKSALDAFEYLDNMLLRTSTHEAFKSFMIGIITPMYDRVSFFQRPGEDLLTLRLRSEAVKWVCQWDHLDCLNNSLTIYKNWMKTPDNVIVPADLKRVITCTAVRNIGLSAWEFAWTMFQKSNIHTEKSDLLSGMGCSTNTSLLSTMLFWTLNSTKLADIYFTDVINGISSGSVAGKFLALDFFRDNWELLKIRYGPVTGRISKAVESITRSFNNLSDLERLESLKTEHGRNDSLTHMLITHLCQLTESNIVWMSKHYRQIDEWLHQLLLL